MTFTFHGTYGNDAPNTLTFRCELTGPTGASLLRLRLGTSGILFDNLIDGDYTFSVFAVDPAGNADLSPATWEFTVAVAPDTIIDDAVDGESTSIANGGTTPTDNMTFTFTVLDGNDAPNTLTFRCELTGPTGTSVPEYDCTSGILFDNLIDGDYTFSVFAVDPAGNADLSPATWEFTVAVAPDTMIDDAVDGEITLYCQRRY